MPTCVHGKQMIPEGEKGIYFICQLEEAFKGSQCRYVRWCPKERKYEAAVDKNKEMCKFFSTKRPPLKELRGTFVGGVTTQKTKTIKQAVEPIEAKKEKVEEKSPPVTKQYVKKD